MTVGAVETSLAIAAERAGDITPLVYARLFAGQPELEKMFLLDQDGALRGNMLAHAVSALLDLVGERQIAEMFVRCEAITHAGYDVPPRVFATFYPALAETIRGILGEHWTAEMAQAWAAAITELHGFVEGYDGALEPA